MKCVICGIEMTSQKTCIVCGKTLSEEYQPLDFLRSSYHLHGKTLIENNLENIFQENKNTASEIALACLVYSLVPYLGIIFLPLALLSVSYAFAVSYKKQNTAGKKLALICFTLSLLLFSAQILLWWLLYLIPKTVKF
ncbi:MAG: hypothetical protein N2Z23_06130 [Pyrinomonadaceae bacterium]|nr:hypothetical protein [Pyrinomonadaceae bacterium]MCX7640000.1 hypothetical protein [Pyrinomonadaceae bacterium]MDW8304172.1 hypothetical protein [Acidobacteriota bacterium]